MTRISWMLHCWFQKHHPGIPCRQIWQKSMCLPPPSSQKANLESGEGRGLQGLHTLKPIYYWLSLLPQFPGVSLCLRLLSSAPLELPRPELSGPSPLGPWLPMALTSAPSLWPCPWGICFSADACRPHFPAVNLPRCAGLHAQLVIQRLTRKLVLSSWLVAILLFTHTDIYKTCMCICLHNIHVLIHTYSLQR